MQPDIHDAAKLNRYGITAALWITAPDEDTAGRIARNFLDGFPDAVNNESGVCDGDVMFQEIELEDENVEAEDAD